MENLSFRELKIVYDGVNPKCKRIEKYNDRSHFISGVSCKQFSCARCRPKLKNQLFVNVITAISVFGLDKHIILTSEGKDFRLKYNYDQSFNKMQGSWNKFKQVINYHYGKFDYVLFPRSQADGYCHYHLITNIGYVPQKWLEEKRKKYKNMGFTSIQRNKDLAAYLTNDFWKDNEYVIPKSRHHFYGSKEVSKYLSLFIEGSSNNHIMKYCKKDHRNKVDQYQSQMDNINGYPLPMDQYAKMFIDVKWKNFPMLPGEYVNGRLVKPMIRGRYNK